MSNVNDYVLVDKINGSNEPTKFKTVAATGAMPAPGSNMCILFNDSGVIGTDSNFTFNKTNDILTNLYWSVASYFDGTNAADMSVSAAGGASCFVTMWSEPGATNAAVSLSAGSYSASITSGGAFSTSGRIGIPATTSTVGHLTINGIRFLHQYGNTTNTFVGYESGNFTLTSTNTTCYGNQTGKFLTGGSGNTLFGDQAGGPSLTTGGNNAAFGYLALGAVTGSGNVGVGRGAGANITSANQSVAIGQQAQPPSATLNGQLSIQNIIYGFNNTGTLTTVSTGRIAIGTSTDDGVNRFQVLDNIAQYNLANSVTGAQHVFRKSRAKGVVANGDIVGDLAYEGFDGSNYIPTALIRVGINGTPGTNDMPGRIQFWTTADGAASVSHRGEINQAGEWLIGTSIAVGNGIKLHVEGGGRVQAMIAYGGYADANIAGMGQGGYTTWNRHGGVGAMELVNHKGGGAGGFYFTNTDGTTFTDIARLNEFGEWNSKGNYGSALVNKGVVGTTVTLDWRSGMVQRFQTTSATNITISWTAPSQPTFFFMKIVAPASGTTPTMTWPTHKGTALPATITLTKTRTAFIEYDGTDYIVHSLTAEY